jgi:RHS repeat-associated protein
MPVTNRTSANGYVVARHRKSTLIADAYGKPLWDYPSTTYAVHHGAAMRAQRQPLQYKGQAGYYADVHTGLYYCHHRYYNPTMARWMSVDPIGLDGGFNVYEYCGGDPVNFVDPSGLDWDWGRYFMDVRDVFYGYGDAARSVVTGIFALPDTVRHYNSMGWSWGAQFWSDTKTGMGNWAEGIQGNNGARGFGQSFGNTLLTVGSIAAPYAKAPPTIVAIRFDSAAATLVHLEAASVTLRAGTFVQKSSGIRALDYVLTGGGPNVKLFGNNLGHGYPMSSFVKFEVSRADLALLSPAVGEPLWFSPLKNMMGQRTIKSTGSFPIRF